MTPARLVLAALLTLCASSGVSAQVYDRPGRGMIEVSGGGAWSQGFNVDAEDATLTRGTGNEPFELFTVEGNVDPYPGAHVRIGVFVTDAVSVEGGLRFARPKLAYELSGDAESAADEVATETVSQYIFDGSVLFHFLEASFGGGRGVPFVSGGAGYIRELHERAELVETGNEIHATIGVKYWFGDGRRRVGLRGEAGVMSRRNGFDPKDARRTLPLVLGGVTLTF